MRDDEAEQGTPSLLERNMKIVIRYKKGGLKKGGEKSRHIGLDVKKRQVCALGECLKVPEGYKHP